MASDAGPTRAAYQQAISTRKQRDPRRDPPFSFELRSVAGGRVSVSSSRYVCNQSERLDSTRDAEGVFGTSGDQCGHR